MKILHCVLSAALVFGAAVASSSAFAAEAVINESSFTCVHTGTKIRKTYLRHADPKKLEEALRIFRDNVEGEYPDGTIIQLVPNEAMVKRSKTEFPNTNGWEFFAFEITPTSTKIKSRGDTASNQLGTCLSCHQAAVKFDYVCEKGHGCAPIPVTDEQILAIQSKDPRCTAP